MSLVGDLSIGLAQYLAANGIGAYTPGAVYASSDTGIFIKGLGESPDRAVAITCYATSDEAKINDTKFRVQFWTRGLPNDSLDVDDIGDAIFNLIQGMEHVQFGSVHVVQALRVSSSTLGTDTNSRTQRSDNYEFDTNVPSTPGRPD
jgi:hypothetical protein